MSVAFGVPARVVALLKDIKPSLPGSVITAHTLEDAVGLGNRLPYLSDGDRREELIGDGRRARGPAGLLGVERYFDDEGLGVGDGVGVDGGGGVVDRQRRLDLALGLRDVDLIDMGVDLDVDLDVDAAAADGAPRRPFSLRSGASSRTAQSVRVGPAQRRDLHSEREVKALLLQQRRRQQHQRVRRRFGVEAIVVMTVVVALLMVFFFAGVYWGASKISGLGSP